MVRGTVLAATMLIVVSVQASAQYSGERTMMGFGSASCAVWSGERAGKTLRSYAMEFWVLGFISGTNWASPADRKDLLAGMDADAMWSWLDNYCRLRPLEPLSASVVGLINELRQRAERPSAR
jgi:hypothetical protein